MILESNNFKLIYPEYAIPPHIFGVFTEMQPDIMANNRPLYMCFLLTLYAITGPKRFLCRSTWLDSNGLFSIPSKATC